MSTSTAAVVANKPSSPAASPVEQNKATALREIEQFEGAAKNELAASLFTPGYRLHFAGQPPMELAGHQAVLSMFRAAFPDLQISVLCQVAQDDRVANHFVMRGTHRGAFQNIPATGKSITVTGTNLMRLEQGKIAELWGQVDMVGLMQQLGVVPGGGAVQVPQPIECRLAAPGSSDPVRRFVAAFNRQDVAALSKEYDASYLLDFPGGPSGEGVEGIRAATDAFIAAFPDLEFSIDDLIEQGDLAVWRWTMTGTHQGQLAEWPASGKPVRLTGISLFTVREGKIVRDRVRADMMGLLVQIGVVPAP